MLNIVYANSVDADQDLHCLPIYEYFETFVRVANRIMVISPNIVCVEVLRPSQPNGVMSSVVSLPNHTFTGQA